MGTKIKIINTSIHLLILFSIAFLFLSIAVCLHKVHELSDESVSLDQGYIYISIQHESDPLVLDNTTNTLDGFRSLYNSLSSSGYRYIDSRWIVLGLAMSFMMPILLNYLHFASRLCVCK